MQGVRKTLPALGFVVWHQGDCDRAVEMLEESLTLSRELGSKRGITLSLYFLGSLALFQEDYGRAAELLEESLTLNLEERNKRDIAQHLEGLGGVAVGQGHAKRAARLYGAAEALRQASGAPMAPSEHSDHNPRRAAARSELGEEEFEAAWAEGRKMSLEDVISYALEKGESNV